jgi:NADH:ubiquinone oxidoreductase subunit 3 (subunit A)
MNLIGPLERSLSLLAFQGWPAWIGLPLALLIIVSPIACLILFVLSLGRSRPQPFRQRCAIAVFVLPLAALALYAIYEAGVPPEDNIRIDLLLIYPVLAIDFLFWPALLIRYLVNRSG